MTEFKPWYVLNVDISNAIRPDFDFGKLLEQKKLQGTAPGYMWEYHQDNINQLYSSEWLDYMNSINLPVNNTLIFWRKPNYQHPTMHIDSPHKKTGKLGLSLNWCIGPDTGEMIWYEIPDKPGRFTQTETGSLNHDWPVEDGVEITRRCIGSTPTIVRIDLPHNVIMKDCPRLLISCRIKNFQPTTWEESVNQLQYLIIE